MKVAAYIRVSTERQVIEGNGLEEQRNSIREFCKEKGYEIVQWFEDAGISGAELELREAMQKLLKDSKGLDRPFDGVVATKIDRLARSLYGQLFVEKELNVAGVSIFYAQQTNLVGTDPMTVAFRQMMGVFAELEKALIASRLTGGRLTKARKGGYAGGRPPFGYQATDKVGLVPQDGQTLVIHRIFELHGQGLSLRQIAVKLNEEGHVTAEGTQWQHKQVSRVINRRALYEGQYLYAGVTATGQHEAILKD